MKKPPFWKQAITEDDTRDAVRIAGMSRTALLTNLTRLIVKVRLLEDENAKLRAEAWQRAGWQSEKPRTLDDRLIDLLESE
jgi:hypothetical protein